MIHGRYSLTFEEYLDDSVRDPEAYGLTLESATISRNKYHMDKGEKVPDIPVLNPNLFSKLPSLSSLMDNHGTQTSNA